MRLKVRLMRGCRIFFRTGRLWYQKVLVGGFMRRRLPWASSSFTGSICRLQFLPRASLCLKMKSRAAPKETEAMGQAGSSSFSSSRCSPMWSSPSLYLRQKRIAFKLSKRLHMWLWFLTCLLKQSWMCARLLLWRRLECFPEWESTGRLNGSLQNTCTSNPCLHTSPAFLECCRPFHTLGPLLLLLKDQHGSMQSSVIIQTKKMGVYLWSTPPPPPNAQIAHLLPF